MVFLKKISWFGTCQDARLLLRQLLEEIARSAAVFQRIREEMRRTSHPRGAIKEGFERAFRTIFDANVTTLFAALALLQFGTGPIKGFAVTLSIGIIASMFTAIVVTRFFFDWIYLRRQNLKKFII